MPILNLILIGGISEVISMKTKQFIRKTKKPLNQWKIFNNAKSVFTIENSMSADEEINKIIDENEKESGKKSNRKMSYNCASNISSKKPHKPFDFKSSYFIHKFPKTLFENQNKLINSKILINGNISKPLEFSYPKDPHDPREKCSINFGPKLFSFRSSSRFNFKLKTKYDGKVKNNILESNQFEQSKNLNNNIKLQIYRLNIGSKNDSTENGKNFSSKISNQGDIQTPNIEDCSFNDLEKSCAKISIPVQKIILDRENNNNNNQSNFPKSDKIENIEKNENMENKESINRKEIIKKNENNCFLFWKILKINKICEIFISYLDINIIFNIMQVSKFFNQKQYKILLKKNLKSILNNQLNFEERRDYWRLCASTNFKMHSNPDYFQNLKKNTIYPEILFDIGRTFPNLTYFNKGKEGNIKLASVLNALSFHFSKIGYCQGMNFFCAIIILFLEDEEESFWMAEHIMRIGNFIECINPKLSRLKLILFQIDSFVSFYLNNLFSYFKNVGIRSDFYASQWILTLFTYDMPIEISSKVLDFYLISGWKIIIKLTLALLTLMKDSFINMSPEMVLTIIKSYTKKIHINEEQLFFIAKDYKVTNKMLKTLEKEYDLKNNQFDECKIREIIESSSNLSKKETDNKIFLKESSHSEIKDRKKLDEIESEKMLSLTASSFNYK